MNSPGELAAARWRVAAMLTGMMVILYFGFILLVAYARDWLAHQLVPGLSIGIALGALVIVASWVMTWAYTHWANERFDHRVDELRRR